jgi:hypothetical protein
VWVSLRSYPSTCPTCSCSLPLPRKALHNTRHLKELSLNGNHLCRTGVGGSGSYTLECVQALHELIKHGGALTQISVQVNDIDGRAKASLEAVGLTWGRKVVV